MRKKPVAGMDWFNPMCAAMRDLVSWSRTTTTATVTTVSIKAKMTPKISCLSGVSYVADMVKSAALMPDILGLSTLDMRILACLAAGSATLHVMLPALAAVFSAMVDQVLPESRDSSTLTSPFKRGAVQETFWELPTAQSSPPFAEV